MKLGEILVHKGLISEAQLKRALEAQLIYGGHLGTCLIELGCIDERALGEVLAESFDVGYAHHELFHDIPRYVIATIPEKLVEKHTCIPFRLENKLLDVAMLDPKDLHALDELSFAAGHRLRSWISPEVRLFQAMESYYDIPRRLRYVTLCRQIDEEPMRPLGLGESIAHGATRAKPTRTSSPAAQPGSPARPASAPVARSAAPATAVSAPAARVAPATSASAPRGATAGAVADAAAPADPLATLSQRLSRVHSRDQLSELVLEHVAGAMEHAVLFKVKGAEATVWQAAQKTLDSARAAEVRFDVTREPLVALLQGSEAYQGPLPDPTAYRPFFERLGLTAPSEALLLAIHLDDRLVALFYGDGGAKGKIRGEESEYRRMARKVSMALQMVMLQRKICSV